MSQGSQTEGAIDRLLRVDMTSGTIRATVFPKAWKLLGGRALTAHILSSECDAACDPLAADNVLARLESHAVVGCRIKFVAAKL